MGTSRAENGRAGWDLGCLQVFDLVQGNRHVGRFGQQPGPDGALAHNSGIEFAAEGKDAFALAGDAHQFDLLFEKGIQFLDYDEAVHFGRQSRG